MSEPNVFFNHPETRCPHCEYVVNGLTQIQGGRPCSPPKAGDASICLNCGQVLTYEADCRLREATVKDIRALGSEIFGAIKEAQAFIRKRGRFWVKVEEKS